MEIDLKNIDIEDTQLDILKEQLSLYLSSQGVDDNEEKDLSIVSLFSGCGGMDLGFEGGFIAHKKTISKTSYNDFVEKEIDNSYVELKTTRFKTVFANDILKDARNAWVHNFSKKNYKPEIFHKESIVNLVKLHEQGLEVFPKKVDIVIGGFPCQDFSVAGKRNGFNSQRKHDGKLINGDLPTEETRGKLYYWMKRVVEITEPKIFIAENVKGLVNLSDVKDIIQKDFASANGNGYLVLEPQVLHSASYGVAQSRERVFFIGIKKSELSPTALNELVKKNICEEYNPYPFETHTKKSFTALKDILDIVVEPNESDDISQIHYSKAKFMGKHCQGQSEVNMFGLGPTIRSEHHGNIEFRRLSVENGGKYLDELNSGKKERRLTVRECGLIQSFPPDFDFVIKSDETRRKFLISPSQAYKIIGNAVPPLMAYNLAKRIETVWDKYFKNHSC